MKHKLFLVIFLFVAFFIAACTEEEPIPSVPVETTDLEYLEVARTALTLPQVTTLTDYIILPLSVTNGITITWASNHESINIDGVYAFITRELHDRTVVLTATLTKGTSTLTKTFNVTVPGTFVHVDVVITVEFTVNVPANTPAEDIVAIAGSFGGDLPSWNPADAWAVANKESVTQFTFEIVYTNPTLPMTIEYKWTRGSWETVEKTEENEEVTNRSLTITGDVTTVSVTDTVEKWADLDVAGDLVIRVEFDLTVPSNTPTDGTISIAGSFGADLPAWAPADVWGIATKVSTTEYTFVIEYTNPTLPLTIEYKWTRGSWDNVEKSLENEEIANRTLTITGDELLISVNNVVAKWVDIDLPVVMTDAMRVEEAKIELTLAETTYQNNFMLQLVGLHATVISWISSNTDVITIVGADATVTRPLQNAQVTLTATITLNDVTDQKEFIVTVIGTEPTQDDLDVIAAATALTLTSLANLTADRALPKTGTLDTVVSWSSSHPDSIEIVVDPVTGDINGKVTRLDNIVSGITLTATITKNSATTTKTFTASVRAAAFTTLVTWTIHIPEAIPNAVVITTGSSSNGWNPADLNYGIATKIDATTYQFQKEFSSPNGTNISLQYKWTLQVPGAGFAAWSGEELTLDGAPINNRTLTITRDTTSVETTVVRWRIPVGGTAQSTVVGDLDIVQLTDNRLLDAYKTRNIRIWTPTGYDPENTTVTYPVIYMHDGQNVFDSVTSFAGEWGVDEAITSLMEVGGFGGAIIVAVDNSADRMAEYTYNYSYLSGTKRGDLFMDFITEIVKPYIDANYNTKTGREHTAMAGSSMGGLITFFGGLANLETFGTLIPFSTSTQQVSDAATNIPALLATLNTTLLQNTKFFLYVGTSSDGNAAWPETYKGYLTAAGVPELNVKTYSGVGFTHNEYAWRTHFPMAIEWAYGLTVNKAALQSIYDGLSHVEADYSANSWTVYTIAKTNALTVLNNVDATMTDVVDAHGRLSSAISQLVLLSDMSSAQAVDDMIVPLPTVTAFGSEHEAALNAAQSAYDALTASQKNLVKFYYVLNLLQDKKTSAVPAQSVVDLITALPTLELLDVVTDKAAVTEAKAAYNALTSIGKSLVTNLATLTALEGKIQGTELKVAINALPAAVDLTYAHKAQVEALVVMYNATPSATRTAYLTTEEIAKVTALNNKMLALNVDQMIIDLLPVNELTLDDLPAVQAARTSYNALNATRKALVTQLINLVALEARIVELQSA